MNAIDSVIRDMKNIVRDTEDFLENTADNLNDKARDARRRLVKTLDSAKATCHRWEESAIQGAKQTDEAIHENPYPFLGVAVGVGLLIGILVNRK